MFYDIFLSLCRHKGVTPNKACLDMQLSRSLAAKWKNTGSDPSAETLARIAGYFGVSTDYLLGNGPSGDSLEELARQAGVSKAFLSLAKSAQDSGIEPEDLEDILRSAIAIKRRYREEKK